MMLATWKVRVPAGDRSSNYGSLALCDVLALGFASKPNFFKGCCIAVWGLGLQAVGCRLQGSVLGVL